MQEYLRLLHIPTTSCILAFAIIGSTFSPVLYVDRLLWLLLQLFLGGGIAANYFDEIQGRPWQTKMPKINLWIIGIAAFIASNIIGIYLTITVDSLFYLFSLIWGFFAVTYDLELFEGRFHNSLSLAVSWSSVCLGSYYLQSLVITPQILLISLITACIAGHGRNLYEVAKEVSRDRNPSADKSSRFAWNLLKTLIVYIDTFSMIMLAYKLLA